MQNNNFYLGSMNPVIKPLQEILELNSKTIQSLAQMHSLDLLDVSKPEELLQKNMEIMIRNTHLVLNYVQQVFHILERNASRSVNVAERQVNPQPARQAAKTQGVSRVSRTAKKSVPASSGSRTSAKKTTSSRSQSPLRKAASLVAKATAKKTTAKKTTRKPVASRPTAVKAKKVASKSRSIVKKVSPQVKKVVQKKPSVVSKVSGKTSLKSVKPTVVKHVAKKPVSLKSVAKTKSKTQGFKTATATTPVSKNMVDLRVHSKR